ALALLSPLVIASTAGGRAGRGQLLAGWPLATATYERRLAACPLAGTALRATTTLAGLPQPAVPAGATPCGLALAAIWLEIVYPCIPDQDREDEGGQASTSLAVSRWISAVKLLQSDLATLALGEGGE
ncbi:hypothetical protein BHE74_00046720, partial [Ensete ventricosum]